MTPIEGQRDGDQSRSLNHGLARSEGVPGPTLPPYNTINCQVGRLAVKMLGHNSLRPPLSTNPPSMAKTKILIYRRHMWAVSRGTIASQLCVPACPLSSTYHFSTSFWGNIKFDLLPFGVCAGAVAVPVARLV